MNEAHFQYDGTFEGFLSLVFYAFENKIHPASIAVNGMGNPELFTENILITTQQEKSDRVWKGLIKRTSAKNARIIYVAFLSELPGVEMKLWRYLRKTFISDTKDFYLNMLDEDVYEVVQTAKKVGKEAHRFQGLVRFQETADGVLFAPIDPDHDILGLIVGHFKNRYGEQKWVIYDTKRDYGIYFDLETLNEIRLQNPEVNFSTGQVSAKSKNTEEDDYQKLWQRYYDSINIQQRANPKQMARMMPRRYWKYLPEKNRPSRIE